MEVRIRNGKDNRSEAFARFHRIVCDKPFDEGGSDCGMTPLELMLSALGCCAMRDAADRLGAASRTLDNVELRISAEKGGWPVRVVEIGIEVNAPGLGARDRKALMKAIEACLLHRTLADPPKLKIAMAASAVSAPRPKGPAGLAP